MQEQKTYYEKTTQCKYKGNNFIYETIYNICYILFRKRQLHNRKRLFFVTKMFLIPFLICNALFPILTQVKKLCSIFRRTLKQAFCDNFTTKNRKSLLFHCQNYKTNHSLNSIIQHNTVFVKSHSLTLFKYYWHTFFNT